MPVLDKKVIVGVTTAMAASAAAYLIYTKNRQRGRSRTSLSDPPEIEAVVVEDSSKAVASTSALTAESWAEQMNEADRGRQPSHSESLETEEEVHQVISSKLIDSSTQEYRKGQTQMESPSVASDIHSETSNDSGKGGSTGVGCVMSPVEELVEVPPVYEFEIPQDIVGLLIGRHGCNIKWFMEMSGAFIVIRNHYANDKCRIVSIEGTRDQINSCLRLIRRKFPPSRFPELKLTPLMPPPVTSPHQPMWDSISQLSLPDSVTCEAILSSLVSAGRLFLQQPTHPTFPSLERLDQYMLAVYSQPVGVPGLPSPVEGGVICAAPVLGGWYRAQTLSVDPATDEVLVKFVDYGGYSKLPSSDLKQIRSDFMTLPFQATEVYLANVKPCGDDSDWPADAGAFVERMALGKVLEVVTVGTAEDGIAYVELFFRADNETVSINGALVENGFADWILEGEGLSGGEEVETTN